MRRTIRWVTRPGSPVQAPTEAPESDGREYARRLEPPWRSSLSWDTYDLSISNSPESGWFSWFSFEALAWHPIRVEAEASMPGAGIELRLFSPDTDGAPPLVAYTDAQGRAHLSVLAHAGGLHYLHVRVADRESGRSQRYRLSVDGPSSAADMPATPPSHSRFADVPLWHPYRGAIQALTERRALSGTIKDTQATFAPDLPVWIADFEHALAGLAVPGTRTHFLSDTTPNLWHAQVPSARDRSDGNGDHTISRAAAIQAVVGALETSSPGTLERPPSDFTSVLDGAPLPVEDAAAHVDALRVAEYCGLLSGLWKFGAGWDAAVPISRGETAQLIHAALQVVTGPDGADDGDAADTGSRRPESHLMDSPPESACTSQDDLASGFVPEAHAALDGLMDGLMLDEVPSHPVPVEIDGAAMRAVIADMRARRNTQRHDDADENDGSSPVAEPRRGSVEADVRAAPKKGTNGAKVNGNGATRGVGNGDGSGRDRSRGTSPS